MAGSPDTFEMVITDIFRLEAGRTAFIGHITGG